MKHTEDLGQTTQGEQKPAPVVEQTPVHHEEPKVEQVQHVEPPVQKEEPAPQENGEWDEKEDKEVRIFFWSFWGNFSEFFGIFRNFSEFFGIFRNFSEFFKIFQIYSKKS
jgi:hypothetical protein